MKEATAIGPLGRAFQKGIWVKGQEGSFLEEEEWFVHRGSQSLGGGVERGGK